MLQVESLQVSIQNVEALRGLSLVVPDGAMVGLVGRNGAGKTTLVNMITGYLKPDSGHILLEGRDITRLAPRAITRLGVARSFQIPQLCGDLTVLDNMLVANACHDAGLSFWKPARRAETVDRAEALLERFRLQDQRHRRGAELAGGMRKLLDIAMALCAEPRILLLDEPTSGVAAEEKFPMMDTVMRGLADDGAMTVLFVEHDMDIVERYASRVIAFYAGRVIADGAPEAALGADDVRRYVTGELLAE